MSEDNHSDDSAENIKAIVARLHAGLIQANETFRKNPGKVQSRRLKHSIALLRRLGCRKRVNSFRSCTCKRSSMILRAALLVYSCSLRLSQGGLERAPLYRGCKQSSCFVSIC